MSTTLLLISMKIFLKCSLLDYVPKSHLCNPSPGDEPTPPAQLFLCVTSFLHLMYKMNIRNLTEKYVRNDYSVLSIMVYGES